VLAHEDSQEPSWSLLQGGIIPRRLMIYATAAAAESEDKRLTIELPFFSRQVMALSSLASAWSCHGRVPGDSWIDDA
jgi:hypothetical protein